MGDLFSVDRCMLSLALHRQFLEKRRKALQRLLKRQHCYRLRTEKVIVPKGQQAHDQGEIGLKWRRAEMPNHLAKAIRKGAEILPTYGNHG